MQPAPPRGPPGAAPAPRPVRPLMQQSNQFVKRLTLVGIHMKQASDPSLASESVKETLIQFFGYLTDRILDYTLTTLSRTASQQEEMGIEDVRHFCESFLGYASPATKDRTPSSQALNLSLHRRKGRFPRLDSSKVGMSVFKREHLAGKGIKRS
eukprot:Gregarina_sp_Pseudo_9__2481@NODE_2761_length_880_cov_12_980975_g2526_i0_p1_GENE_NODE_2761_length_880_cov_12_980975_g2526_i0NODE_2761_length_880_cov_12_980975_g2526_i0_p1_ORF_typecomplete_len154_score18_98_NODE_2761_length_880_cov_12_980975_g2526_i0261722